MTGRATARAAALGGRTGAMTVLAIVTLSAARLAAGGAGAQSAQPVRPSVAPASAATFTAEQAERGRRLYADHCASCHGGDLSDGPAPALVGPTFRRTWSRPNVTVDDLLHVTSTTMPPLGAGDLETRDHVDILAHILSTNGIEAGTTPLADDREHLRAISLIRPDDEALGRDVAIVRGSRTAPRGRGPSARDLVDGAARAGDWLYHTRDFAGTRHSPLSQIDEANVGELRPVCLFQLGELRPFQSGPIVHEGVMYVTGVRTTAAIDAATCRPIWRHVWEPKDREIWPNNRGVAIQDGYVVRGTTDGYLMALDASDGALIWARQAADPWLGETFTMAPLVHDGVIVIGPAGSENAISGWVGAFRLEDGEDIWRFHTVPGARREGGDTWANPTGIPVGGGAIWTPLSLDPARGELYVAVTNPAPDLPADLRPGPNLYTNSIVALDVATGALRWYEQLVPNDEHDWDLTQVSPLYRHLAGGKERELVATVGKDGLLRVLDRETRERIFEAPVTTRENVDAPVTTEGTRACPGLLGGVEWNGPTYHPATGTLITPAVDWCFEFREFEPEQVRYVEGQMYLGGEATPAGPRTGWITSVDAGSGALRWRYRSDDAVLAAVTSTAGGIVFAGELSGDFIALSADTGDVLYRFNTGGPIGGGIVTYEAGGRQLVAVAAGRPSNFFQFEHPGSPTVVVFGLR